MAGTKNRRGEGFMFQDPRFDTDQRRTNSREGRPAKVITTPQQRDQRNGGNRPESEQNDLPLGRYQAVLFDPTQNMGSDYGVFVEKVPLIEGENQDLFYKVRYSIFDEDGRPKGQPVDDQVNMTAWFKKKNRSIQTEGTSLVSADLPLCRDGGIAGVMLFLKLPGCGGIRMHKPEGFTPGPPLSEEEYRIQYAWIEKKYQNDTDRQRAKNALPKKGLWLFPGHHGRGLMQWGIRLVIPLFLSNMERKVKRPHEHVILMERGTSIEVMFEYNKALDIPNWFVLHCNEEGDLRAEDIRAENGPYVRAAVERIAQEKEMAAKAIVEDMSGI